MKNKMTQGQAEGVVPIGSKDLLSGVELIEAERQRQVSVEGWTPEHDDGHENGELAQAAACYILSSQDENSKMWPPTPWPFDAEWWKPNDDHVRNLVRAGALIAAEIERLQRVQKSKPDNDKVSHGRENQ